MEADAILKIMRSFFKDKQPEASREDFAELSARTLLKESLDVVDFIVFLEEEMGCEIDIRQVGEALMSKSFGEIAGDLAQHMASG